MKPLPCNQPLAVLLTGLAGMLALAQLDRFGVVDDSTGFAVFLILFGVALAIIQVRSGFTLQRGVSREGDPFFFKAGLVITTVPFVLLGVFMLFS